VDSSRYSQPLEGNQIGGVRYEISMDITLYIAACLCLGDGPEHHPASDIAKQPASGAEQPDRHKPAERNKPADRNSTDRA
jgi:hypothetical protein